VIRFFGLQPSKLNRNEKIRAIFIFFSIYVLNLILYLIELMRKETFEEQVVALQTLPTLIIILFDAVNL
jgi:multisubunit Na+/H+ antiporter MnhF subunit